MIIYDNFLLIILEIPSVYAKYKIILGSFSTYFIKNAIALCQIYDNFIIILLLYQKCYNLYQIYDNFIIPFYLLHHK